MSRIYRLELGSDIRFAPDPELDLRRISQGDVEKSADPMLSERGWYGGDDAYGFGLWEGGELSAMCWFWNQRRFRDPALWEIGPREAIMVDLVTAEAHRGKGLASIVTKFAAGELKRDGFERLVTWVWHSNYPSIRSFEKAGWVYIAFVVNLHVFGSTKPIRLLWNVRPRPKR